MLYRSLKPKSSQDELAHTRGACVRRVQGGGREGGREGDRIRGGRFRIARMLVGTCHHETHQTLKMRK